MKRKKDVTIRLATFMLAISMLVPQVFVGGMETYASEITNSTEQAVFSSEMSSLVNLDTDITVEDTDNTVEDTDLDEDISDASNNDSDELYGDSSEGVVDDEELSDDNEQLPGENINITDDESDDAISDDMETADTEDISASEDESEEDGIEEDEIEEDEFEEGDFDEDELADDEIEELEEGEEVIADEPLDAAAVKYQITIPKGHYKVGLSPDSLGTTLTTTVDNSSNLTIYFKLDAGYILRDVTPSRDALDKSEDAWVVMFHSSNSKIIINTSQFNKDVTITPNVARTFKVENVPGAYKIRINTEDIATKFEEQISDTICDDEPFSFTISPGSYCRITKVTYQIGSGPKKVLERVSNNWSNYDYEIPQSEIKGNIKIDATIMRDLTVYLDDKLKIKFLDGNCTIDPKYSNEYYTTYLFDARKLKDEINFTITGDASSVPYWNRTNASDADREAFKYYKYTYTAAGQYTYYYRLPVEKLRESINYAIGDGRYTRNMTVKYDAKDVNDFMVRVEGRNFWDGSKSSIDVPVNKTLYFRFKPKSGVKIEKIQVTNKDTGTVKTLKYASEIAFKPMEDCEVSIVTRTSYSSIICKKSNRAIVSPVKGVVMLSPYVEYSTGLYRNGEYAGGIASNYITEIYDGRTNITSNVYCWDKATDINNEYILKNLQDYAGKTLVMNCYQEGKVPGKDKPDSVTKMKIYNSADQFKTVTLNGKTQRTVSPGYTTTYKLGMVPANYEWDRVYAEGKNGVNIAKLVGPNDAGKLLVSLDPSVTSQPSFEAGEIYISYEIGGVKVPLTSQPIKVLAKKSVIETATPVVSVAYATDKTVTLKLSLPKTVSENLENLNFNVVAECIYDNGKTAPNANMIDGIVVDAKPNGRNAYATISLVKNTSQPGNVQKYRFSVTLSQRDDGTDIYQSKVKTIIASTKPVRSETKLNIQDVKTKFYDEELSDGLVVAKVKFSSSTTIRDVIIKGPDINYYGPGKSTQTYSQMCPDGTVDIVMKSTAGLYDIEPGTYYITVFTVPGIDGKILTKTIPITILAPAYRVKLVKDYETVENFKGGKAMSFQPRIERIEDRRGNKLTNKSVTWQLDLGKLNSYQRQHIKIDAKTGKVTIDKYFILQYDKHEQEIRVVGRVNDTKNGYAICDYKVVLVNYINYERD